MFLVEVKTRRGGSVEAMGSPKEKKGPAEDGGRRKSGGNWWRNSETAIQIVVLQWKESGNRRRGRVSSGSKSLRRRQDN